MESEAWGQTSKSQKTEDTLESLDLTTTSSAIEVYQAPSLAIVPAVNFKFTFEELGVLTRDEVLPYVDTSRVRDDGIVTINSAMFSRGAVEGAKEYNIDISVEGLRRLVDFHAAGDCANIVKPSVIEKIFFDHCGQKHKKDAWKVIAPWFSFNLKNAQPRSEGWVIDDFRKFTLENHPHGSILDMKVRLVIRQVLKTLGKLSQQYCSTTMVLLAVAHVDPTCAHLRPDWHMFVSSEIRKSLNHEKTDKKSAGKFREGWAAIIDLVRNEFMAKQAAQSKEPLYLEAKNAFSDTKAEWDNEKCELVRQREELKEELAKAQEQAALAARREETICLEKDALQKEYSRDKADWESKNHKLAEEVNQLHDDMKRVSTKEELVQAELSEIRSQMEVFAKNTGEATGLKLELEAKEEELRKLQEADKKIRQRLKTAKKKGKELEGELKKMPAGVLVKPESRVMELLKSGKKWQLSCYPKVFDAKDLTEWKGSVVPVPCTFYKGLIAPGTDLRIPTCGHSYHISCVCSSFGLNHLACWAESCSQTLPTPWIHELCLDRQVDFEAFKERYMCSWDMRSFPPNVEIFATEQDMLHITGVPQIRAQCTKWLRELGKALDEKTLHSIHASKSSARLLLFAPQHTIPGTQFRLWSRKNGGIPITEWGKLWGYPSTDFWVFSKQEARHDMAKHNRCFLAITLDTYRGEYLLQSLCSLNMALSLHLRPGDGLFLECFAAILLSLPWVAELLRSLVEKKFMTVWATRRIPLETLQSPTSYVTDAAHAVLAPLFASSKVWRCEYCPAQASTSEAVESDHECVEPPQLPALSRLWLAIRP
ncbi:hypothetical protein R1sor_003619 [Riccia sorocarpa]|uniref:RING-type domain-containing protein n=1 Tax=Riccia sorocarpa TaxID=122646 RepID=A0ABD3H516_9MARC